MAQLCSIIQFVDAALACSFPFALSYGDPDQKWVIRRHLLSLFQDFPTLLPSADIFVHNDGATVYLLNAKGHLLVSKTTPPVPLTIWVHQNYPSAPPIVFLSPTSDNPVLGYHPFVDSSGFTTLPYLETWLYPRSNLSDLAHNLVLLFSHHHPFSFPSASAMRRFTNPCLASKEEAIDRLFGALHCDVVSKRAQLDEDIQGLLRLQDRLQDRAKITTTILEGAEHEKTSLERRLAEVTEEVDKLEDWLKVHGSNFDVSTEVDDDMGAFQATDLESASRLNFMVKDKAIEDVLYALDEALMEEVVSSEQYIRQVRSLAKNQFYYRNRLIKLTETKTS
uniref:Protein ELC-like n=1 Tax=Nelumbo nucifera TaxID=4432 RepID=A0A822XJ23_NELNU|nr:TPA_asm: hypothetical protein HUJ06_021166 [Nelumbo nucifera]